MTSISMLTVADLKSGDRIDTMLHGWVTLTSVGPGWDANSFHLEGLLDDRDLKWWGDYENHPIQVERDWSKQS